MDQNPEDIIFVDFKCPHCGCTVSFPETSLGSVQDCPDCSEILIIPEKKNQLAAKLPIPLQTPRLLLRRLTPADAYDLVDLMADEESFRYIDWNPLDETEVEEWLARDQNTRLTQPGADLCLAVELLEEPKVVGFVSLYYLDESRRQMSFVAVVNRALRRRGFGTEAVRGAADVAFTGLKTHRLSVSCDIRNIGACRMLEKAGLRREGECIKGEFLKGKWVDAFLYALLREEYSSAA
jgi:RimJ/RimL family protein N-acetyltransferase